MLSPYKLAKKIGIEPFNKQYEVIESVLNNRITCVKASRRGGKSLTAAILANATLLDPSSRVSILAPTNNLTNIIFSRTTNMLTNTLSIKPTSLNQKEKKMLLPWNSVLATASMRNMKQVLGVSNNLFIIDELAVSEQSDLTFLVQDILPTLLEYNGHLLAISTPRGFNIFYDLFQYAKKSKDAATISYSVYDLPYIDEKQIQSLKTHYDNLGLSLVFKQEFLAEFLSFSDAIYTFELRSAKQVPDGLDYFIGVDPGATHPTAIVTIARDANNVYIVDTYRKAGLSTTDHAKYLQELIEKYEPVEIYIDGAAKQTSLDLAYIHDISCRNAIKSVDDGINYIRGLANNIYLVGDHPEFVEEFNNYHTKNNAVFKKGDDLMDAFRYCVYSSFLDYFKD